MQWALYGSFAVLWVVVALQTVVLLEVLGRVVRLKREIQEATPAEVKEERLAGGTVVEFTAPDLTRGGVMRSSELPGAPAALLFLAAGSWGEGEQLPEWLLDTYAGLHAKAEGRIYVLCDGDEAACSALARQTGPEIPVLLDQGGRVRQRFLVSVLPAAVILDEQAGVSMYGRPEWPVA
jgi:hypothetical protein